MLMLRLQRVGRKHHPVFRVVVTDKRNGTKSGRFLEVIGSFDAKMGKTALDKDRVSHWLSKGAKATPTLHNILVTKGVVKGPKINPIRKPKQVAEIAPAKKDAVVPGETPRETTEAPTVTGSADNAPESQTEEATVAELPTEEKA